MKKPELRKYPNYKPSRIEWIDDASTSSARGIPEHWDVKRIKYVADINGGYAFKSEYFENEGYPVVRIGDVAPKINFENCIKTREENIPNEFKLRKNDVLIALSGATVGKMCFINEDYEAFVNQRVARVNNGSKYLYFTLISNFLLEQILLAAGGSAQENISTNTIGNFFIPIPPLSEQIFIANFLDDKTAKIDSLIEKKKKLIELYKEERTAVINEAVTRGINPNVKLKPSGIVFFPELPQHWEVVKFNHFIRLRHGFQFMNSDFTENGIKVVKITQLNSDGTLELSNVTYIDESRLNEFQDIIIKEGDILMALTGGTIGKIIKVEKVNEPLVQNYRVGHFSPLNPKLTFNYMFWLLSSDIILNQIFFEQRETGQPNIGKEDFNRMKIPHPPVEEQQQIVEYIDAETKRIDEKIKRTEKEIELLQEYRTALISEVVTGKIKVIDN